MIVVVIVGVLSALGAPSIARMLEASESKRGVVESAASISIARDSARGFGTCLEYLVQPAAPAPGPYVVELFAVSCPGDSGPPVRTKLGFTKPLSKQLTLMTIRPIIGGLPQAPVDAIRFDRSGALYDPVAELRIDGVFGGKPRVFHIYPAAGTISIEEQQ